MAIVFTGEKRGEEVTYKTFVHEITINTDEDGYMSVTVKHEGPDTATDSGSQQEISGIIGTDVPLVNKVCKMMAWHIQKVTNSNRSQNGRTRQNSRLLG